MNKNDMAYWHQLVRHCDVLQPRTEMVRAHPTETEAMTRLAWGESGSSSEWLAGDSYVSDDVREFGGEST